jgi:type I restriction enzyme S subunit
MNKVKLSSIIDIISGGTPKTDVKHYWENGSIGWLSVTDFNNDLRYVYSTEKQITEEGLKNSNTKLLNRGDIIISARGTVGALAQIGTPMCFNQSCFGLRGKKGIVETDFLYYALKNYVHNIKKRSQGSVFDTINLNSFDLMEIEIPKELDTQQKIASVLSALDSKIELNNRINAELEAMAKTLYDYWFVQFDFPDKNGKPYKTSGGKMVWNEELKREVPEGWEVQKMAEWLDIDKSGDWGKEETEGNFTKQVICFRGADINGLNGLDELKPPVRWILEKNSFKILKSHDLIIEISGGSPTQSTGRLAFITDATIKRFEHPLICSNFCKPVSMRNKKLLYNFVYYWNSLYDNGIFFGYEGKTSGIKNLLLDSFISSYYTVVPDEKIVEQFYDLMDNIQEKKQTTLAENQKLTELRDWLLPMLMNGQVKVN